MALLGQQLLIAHYFLNSNYIQNRKALYPILLLVPSLVFLLLVFHSREDFTEIILQLKGSSWKLAKASVSC